MSVTSFLDRVFRGPDAQNKRQKVEDDIERLHVRIATTMEEIDHLDQQNRQIAESSSRLMKQWVSMGRIMNEDSRGATRAD